MEKIIEWKARRSGGRITITGKDETEHPSRWPNIDTIEPMPAGRVVATDKNGERFELVI
jgi:hypothetical protein